METTSQQINESVRQPDVIVATEDESQVVAIAELDRRVRELETAIGDLRSVKASAGIVRKTSATMMAKGVKNADVDEALRSLSVEQRIAVKSGLMRTGLL